MRTANANRPSVWAWVLILLIHPAEALAAVIDMHVDLRKDVVYCDASLAEREGRHIRRALKEGTPVTFTWEIRIEVINTYWLNTTLASVRVVRKVVPDLVSGTWRLQDLTSGIERKVGDVDAAMRFLTRLRHFPVIDRSLLARGSPYRMVVALEEREGEEESGWWSRWWGYHKKEAAKDFALP